MHCLTGYVHAQLQIRDLVIDLKNYFAQTTSFSPRKYLSRNSILTSRSLSLRKRSSASIALQILILTSRRSSLWTSSLSDLQSTVLLALNVSRGPERGDGQRSVERFISVYIDFNLYAMFKIV